MEKYLDPVFWYGNRQVEFTPTHFIVTKTPLTDEMLLWVFNNLHGRFSIIYNHEEMQQLNPMVVFFSTINIAFEDPKEAILYELTWS